MKFSYEAISSDGRTVVGEIEAPSDRRARRDLAARGLTPLRLDDATAAAVRGRRLFARPAALRDYAGALRELHTLLGGGVQLAEAVPLIAGAASQPQVARALDEMATLLRRGSRFADACRATLPMLPPYAHALVEAGELSGKLVPALGDALVQVEHDLQVRAELRSSLIYPAILVAAGLAAVVFVFLYVVPQFLPMFRGRMEELPFASRLVFDIGTRLDAHPWLALGILGAVVAAIAALVRSPTAREAMVQRAGRLPVTGRWLAETDAARWATVFARLIENRVPLLRALELGRQVVRLDSANAQLAQVERAVRSGGALADALAEYSGMPATVINLVRVGERSGRLAETMRIVATTHEGALRQRTRRILMVVEPAAILLIGGLIGFVAVAIMSAITSINQIPI
ncbi:type II secretion system F family protein [Zavarzinia sp. CC-PAN008]|uniref:type II secretion system F family protein n=1 Tax=Zavarzinia sp. CC-PAN008 TaxID=3243332 RepID=UPI003F747E87